MKPKEDVAHERTSGERLAELHLNPGFELESCRPPAPPVQPGDVIDGKYRVTQVLGAGGMGIVVAATHLMLDRPIAIKFMSPLLANAANDMGVRRFMQEARAAARIQSEHVVRIFDVATLTDGTPYIVMEHLQGCDLEHLLQRRGRLPVEEAVGYVLEACEAIAEAHVAGIIHRDLKPGNLFIGTRADGSPLVKVLDFGVSKLLPTASGMRPDNVMTGPHVIMGSPLYSSPEQLLAVSSVDARSDVWSLGTILYEMIAGTPPFSAETFLEACAKITHASHRPLSKRIPHLPAGFDAVIDGTLAKDPDQRFRSVAQLARRLEPFAPRAAATLVERIVNVVDRRGPSGSGPLADTLLSPGSPRPLVRGAQDKETTHVRTRAQEAHGVVRIVGAVFAALVLAGIAIVWWRESTTYPSYAAPQAAMAAQLTELPVPRAKAPEVPSVATPLVSVEELPPAPASPPSAAPAVPPGRPAPPAAKPANTSGFGGLL